MIGQPLPDPCCSHRYSPLGPLTGAAFRDDQMQQGQTLVVRRTNIPRPLWPHGSTVHALRPLSRAYGSAHPSGVTRPMSRMDFVVDWN